jgi:serine/threonine protein kinase
MSKFVDNFSNQHYVAFELARGGQGVVYKTRDPDTVIKMALENEREIRDEEKIREYHLRIKSLIYKPIPSDINIAKPLTLINGKAGYVMNLLEGMTPLSSIFPGELRKDQANAIEIPEFLQGLADKRAASYIAYYLKTGGLRKRLYLLSRLAKELYRLHSRGLVYQDLSHNNVFVNDETIPLVYLIDADNLEYESSNRQCIFTPQFEAPEVAMGENNTVYSDIYAFGILAFMTLTTVHPFNGEAANNDDWDNDGQPKEIWELPWIEDSRDNSNRSNTGLRGQLSISTELDFLFHRLFEEGRLDKFERPTLPIWIETLEKAAASTVQCQSCQMTYYEERFERCPYCDAEKPSRVLVDSFVFKNGSRSRKRWRFVKEIKPQTNFVKLPAYLFKPLDILNINDWFVQMKLTSNIRVEFDIDVRNETVCFNSDIPIHVFKKKIGRSSAENGIYLTVEDDITILVEIRLVQ